MTSFAMSVRRFLASEDGPTSVRYALLFALIVVASLAALTHLTPNLPAA